MAGLRAFAASMSRIEPVRLTRPLPAPRASKSTIEPVMKACVVCGKACPPRHWATCGDPECKRKLHRAAERNREHIERAAVSDITVRQEAEMRRKAKNCPLCGVRMLDTPCLPASKELDHILPIAMGGTHTLGNTRIICRRCNQRRPKDGSDYTGQLSLWAQGPSPVGRLRTTCKNGLHPWIPENILVSGGGKKLCGPCRREHDHRKRGTQMQRCACGALYAAPGRTFMCPDCTESAARRAAELHGSGLTWAEVAQQTGYQTAEGARFAAKRIGYTARVPKQKQALSAA
jgi:5-methylcytosine-specific restriction endonuclease McrA